MTDQFHIEFSGLLQEARDLLNSGRPELAEAVMDEAENYYRRALDQLDQLNQKETEAIHQSI